MDQIILYKEDQNLKEAIQQVRFSYTRPYTLTFATQYDQLGVLFENHSTCLLYYLVNDLLEIDRIRLKYIHMHHPQVHICFCGPEKNALDAWKLKVFHFEAQPVYSDGIIEAYKKYIVLNGGEAGELILKQDDGVRKIPMNSLLYLQAAGNYTSLIMSSGRTMLQTKQLGTFEFLTEQDLNFHRVHRSLIINMKKIKALKNNKVHFYDTERLLEVSGPLALKIKNLLLGS